MLPFVATSIATVAILIFGLAKPTFPTYQIESFQVVDFSVKYPPWVGSSSKAFAWPSTSACTSDISSWRCCLWDWEGLVAAINCLENGMMQSLASLYPQDIRWLVKKWGNYNRSEMDQEEERRIRKHSEKSSSQNFTIHNASSFFESYLNFELSAHVFAGISIDNRENQFGAHVHRAVLDLYHQDWDGKLLGIGSIQNRFGDTVTEAVSNSSNASESEAKNGGVAEVEISWDGSSNRFQESHVNTTKGSDDIVYEHWIASNKTTAIENVPSFQDDATTSTTSPSPDQYRQPSFSAPPRSVTYTAEDAFSLFLRKISPRTCLSVLRDLIANRGILRIPTSGAVHLQMTSSLVPFTVGVICENEVHLSLKSLMSFATFFPSFGNLVGETSLGLRKRTGLTWISIEKVECSIERMATGWWNATKMADDLRRLVVTRHQDNGIVLVK